MINHLNNHPVSSEETLNRVPILKIRCHTTLSRLASRRALGTPQEQCWLECTVVSGNSCTSPAKFLNISLIIVDPNNIRFLTVCQLKLHTIVYNSGIRMRHCVTRREICITSSCTNLSLSYIFAGLSCPFNDFRNFGWSATALLSSEISLWSSIFLKPLFTMVLPANIYTGLLAV